MLKVSSTFSKVVESRGKASGRAPQSAKYLRSLKAALQKSFDKINTARP